MTFEGSVDRLVDMAPDVDVTITNVRRLSAAAWREYGGAVTVRMPAQAARSFFIGRPVRIEVTPR